MPLINQYYVFVENEKITRGVSVTSHPVEKGFNITDNVKREPISLSISGKIVKVGNTKAATIKSAIEKLHQGGKYVKYQGVNSIKNALITSFNTTNDASINGGYIFDMEIKEIRIAKSAYKASAKTSTTTKQVTKKKATTAKRYYTVKSGDCLWNIAKKYYGNGAQYTKIYNANRNVIKNPNLIYPKQKLLIP